MVVFNYAKLPPEEPRYGRFILRWITVLRPDSSIYSIEDPVENIFSCFNVPENFREEDGQETLEEILRELHTERSP